MSSLVSNDVDTSMGFEEIPVFFPEARAIFVLPKLPASFEGDVGSLTATPTDAVPCLVVLRFCVVD